MKKFLFLLAPLLAFADIDETTQGPWFTGPLQVPLNLVTPVGHVYIESFMNFENEIGNYNSHWKTTSHSDFFTFNPEFFVTVGLTEWMDISLSPQMDTNVYRGRSATRFGDLPIGLDFQLIPYKLGNACPSLKFTFQETFPTGQYQHFNAGSDKVEGSGDGTWGTNINFVLYNVYHLWAKHYLSLYFASSYTFNTSTHVRGFNIYGGGYGTDGVVHVGNMWQNFFSFEFTLTQNWAIAMDNVYTHVDASPFTGDPGTDADGLDAVVGEPSSESFAICPAIEYNFSDNYGLIAGCYFSVAGRNSPFFRNGIISFVAYF
jgi:hypothetical protein